MFSGAFIQVPASEIISSIQRNGYFTMECVLEPDCVDTILNDVNHLQFKVNENHCPVVMTRTQSFCNHFLARSGTAFRVLTSEAVTEICQRALGPVYRMVGKRIYETRSNHYMQFHSDVGSQPAAPLQIDGVGFIFYLCDTYDGEWQTITGSHEWGESYVGSRENDDELIAKHKDHIRSFPMPKGSLIVYNGRMLHRAKPIENDTFSRISMFMQVNRNASTGEPILVDMGYLDGLSDQAKTLLGYGKVATSPPWPQTTEKSLPVAQDSVLQRYFTTWLGGVAMEKIEKIHRVKKSRWQFWK